MTRPKLLLMEEPSMGTFSIADTLRSSLVLVKEKTARHNIDLIDEIDSHLGIFYSDERRVKQILFNLLSNAAKFTVDGGTIWLSAKQKDRSLIISVRDTGIGIPKNRIPIIFEPFHQVDSSLSRMHEGTGLGLALTKRLVEMLGGTINVESEPERGSTFTIKLPIADHREGLPSPEPEEGGEGRASRLPEGTSFKGKRAMVVEDDSLSIRLISDFLKQAGFEVMEATNGEEALESLARELPDVILLDIQMPGMSGLDVAQRLRADDVTSGIPLIAVTALAMEEDERQCMEAGFDAYFKKPLNLHKLIFSIHELMQGETNEDQ